MNILITGAFGFVGSNLSAALKSNFNCRLIALDVNRRDEHFYDEFLNWQQLDKIHELNVSAIIHLAGKAHDTKNTSEASEYFEINVGLTKKIYDCFLQSGAKKFIYFSSVKAVADSVEAKELTEMELPNPQTPYGQSKLEAERYILNQVIPADKQVYILRPAMIHGPGNKGNLNLLYNLINKGLPYPLGAFENQRSFTSIGNLNFIVGQLLAKEIPSDIFQVADNESLSTREIVELMAEVTGKKPMVWNIPVSLIRILAKAGDRLKIPFNSERLKKLTENYLVSNRKLMNALQAELPVSAREGLVHTLSSFRSDFAHNKK